ncbi:LOW QUALITY PROTEIN: hypothetical protein CVT25_013078 [Psilocybe cyanescens]|uniref:Uncharacterized protein n=1 Tax=Psilocybe cyanescens TaxID=93625 RepID=A0A409XWQ2_PSICY|nr:LOW QUALITY PROTEIN: hypothetical protein CVT25_013078 [Psilocybe cyanescens]
MVLVGLVIGFAVTSAVDLWFVITSIPNGTLRLMQTVEIPGGTYCISLEGTFRPFARFWIPPLLFESLLCMMAIYRAVKESTSGTSVSLLIRGQSLMRIMIRDSIMYFLA